MIKFSAGYIPVNPNFVIQNLDEKNNIEPVFAILQNIFTRGCPTIPTQKLREQYDNKLDQTYKYFYDFKNTKWDKVIKGTTQVNPATEFYNDLLTDILGKSNSGTFIAECPMKDIISDLDSQNEGAVDFYSPLYNAVIEIDGIQHQTNDEQIAKDIDRNKVLGLNNIQIIRLTTQELNNINLVK